MLKNTVANSNIETINLGVPRDGEGLARDGGEGYEPGLYRVQITDHGTDDSSGEPALWLEFLPLSRIAALPGDIQGGEATLHGPRCRQFFDVEGGSFDDVHLSTPAQVLRGMRGVCLDPQSYGRPDPGDPYAMIGRQAVVRYERTARGHMAWCLVPVLHLYPRPGCECRTCRDWGKQRRTR
jgi:hypothetical protein